VLDSINASKLYLSLSKWEGIGVANIEALSFATEVILSDIPPHRELWCDDNLYLVDRKTSDMKIAAKIESILSEGKNRQWFLLQRAKETRGRFDLPVLVSSYIKIYDRIAGSR
jgi:glycosyltransferase involved in cell wall biosynthesis